MAPELVFEIDGKRIVHSVRGDEVTIGRSAANDLVIDETSVSRRHARVYRDGGNWRVEDLSRFGTRVNDLEHSNVVLRNGDRILLHRFPLTWLDGSSAGATLRLDMTDPAADPGTVFQSARDFSSLAGVSANVFHLQKLLTLVAKTSQILLSSPSLDETLRGILDMIFEHLPVQRGFIMLWDERRGDFETRAVRNEAASAGEGIQFSRTIADRVRRERVGVLTTDAMTDERFAAGLSVQALGIRSAMAAPLWRGEEVEGLIYVDTPQRSKAFDKDDLDLLSAVGNQIAVAIAQSRLQASVMEQTLIRRRLERYHSPAVIERITGARDDLGQRLVAEEREVSVLYADVVEFTRRSERMEPRQVAELLNHYFSQMTEVVFRHEGTLDKFIGDCLMVVFGAPLPSRDHAERAAEAALEMREALDELNAPLAESERLRFRVSIHSGRVVAGDIGSVRRSDYTVLGATVNLASRLEMVAEPGQIVVSGSTRAALGERFTLRPLGQHALKGISTPVECWELLGRR